jgi:serine kinase of HPr protein (carbohydrate metabolism regulator)
MAGKTPHKTIHASCVAFGARGVLLLGPSGSGKSDLALRAVLQEGAKLVADDRVRLTASGQGLTAEAPAEAQAAGLVGAIEAYGLGILGLPPARRRARVRLCLAVALVPPGEVERLPGDWQAVATGSVESEGFEGLGIALPFLRLAPFEVSAALKLRLAVHNLRLAAGGRSGSIKRLA